MTFLFILVSGLRDLENGLIEKNHLLSLLITGIILDGITISFTALYLKS